MSIINPSKTTKSNAFNFKYGIVDVSKIPVNSNEKSYFIFNNT